MFQTKTRARCLSTWIPKAKESYFRCSIGLQGFRLRKYAITLDNHIPSTKRYINPLSCFVLMKCCVLLPRLSYNRILKPLFDIGGMNLLLSSYADICFEKESISLRWEASCVFGLIGYWAIMW